MLIAGYAQEVSSRRKDRRNRTHVDHVWIDTEFLFAKSCVFSVGFGSFRFRSSFRLRAVTVTILFDIRSRVQSLSCSEVENLSVMFVYCSYEYWLA